MPNVLGHGIIQRVTTSKNPRKMITVTMAAASDASADQPSTESNQTNTAGLVMMATIVAARPSLRQPSLSSAASA